MRRPWKLGAAVSLVADASWTTPMVNLKEDVEHERVRTFVDCVVGGVAVATIVDLPGGGTCARNIESAFCMTRRELDATSTAC
jgi:hypothetical protein